MEEFQPKQYKHLVVKIRWNLLNKNLDILIENCFGLFLSLLDVIKCLSFSHNFILGNCTREEFFLKKATVLDKKSSSVK